MNPFYRPELVNEPKHKQASIKDTNLSTDDRVVLKSQEWLIQEGVHNPFLTIDKSIFVKTKEERNAIKKAKFESQVPFKALKKDFINVIINMRCNFNSLSLIVLPNDKTEEALKFTA